MNAYSLDLRKKIVAAKERGMPTTEVARTFGVGLSSVKRYAAAAREGKPLAPKRRPGSKPKLGEAARKLLEADLEERPAATLPERREFLTRVAGVSVSDSTVSRMLNRMGWNRKKIGGCVRTRRAPEVRLENDGRREHRSRPLRLRGRVLDEHLAAPALRLVATGRAGALLGAAQLGQERHAALQHYAFGHGAVSGGGGGDHEGGLRGVPRGGARPEPAQRAGGGDGQPLGPQGGVG